MADGSDTDFGDSMESTTADSDSDSDSESGAACEPLVWEGNFLEEDPLLLEGYTQVNGLVRIWLGSAQDLTGMACLERANGLAIQENPNLTTFDGLAKFSAIPEGSLRVIENPELVEFSALSTLTEVASRISVERNPNLAMLEGLEGITHGMEIVGIIDNDSLVDLEGLNALTAADMWLAIGENDNLEDITALGNLADVGGLSVYDSPALVSLAGLDGLGNAGSFVKITGNAALSDVSALLGAKVGETATIEIYDNPMLPQCDAEALALALQPPGFTGSLDVQGNLGTCP